MPTTNRWRCGDNPANRDPTPLSSDPMIEPVEITGFDKLNHRPDPMIEPVEITGFDKLNHRPDPMIEPVEITGFDNLNHRTDPR